MTALDVLIAAHDDLAQGGWHRERRSVPSALFRTRQKFPREGWPTAVHDVADWLYWYLGESIVEWNNRQTDAAEVLRVLDQAILRLGGP